MRSPLGARSSPQTPEPRVCGFVARRHFDAFTARLRGRDQDEARETARAADARARLGPGNYASKLHLARTGTPLVLSSSGPVGVGFGGRASAPVFGSGGGGGGGGGGSPTEFDLSPRVLSPRSFISSALGSPRADPRLGASNTLWAPRPGSAAGGGSAEAPFVHQIPTAELAHSGTAWAEGTPTLQLGGHGHTWVGGATHGIRPDEQFVRLAREDRGKSQAEASEGGWRPTEAGWSQPMGYQKVLTRQQQKNEWARSQHNMFGKYSGGLANEADAAIQTQSR